MKDISRNPRVKKINDRRASLPVYPPFEPYTTVDQLYAAAENCARNNMVATRRGVAVDRDEEKNIRRHYAELREAILSVGGDITRIPRRLRLKVEGVAA